MLGREEDGSVEIGPAEGFGGAAPTLVFGPVADPTPGKLRLHIDVNPTDRDQDAELERLLALGAVPADVGQPGDEGWHVLADPEGNEFCLLKRPRSTHSEGVPGDPDRREVPRPARARRRVGGRVAADYARAVNAEEGSLFFEWSRSLEEPDTFVCVEGFRDAAAGASHVRHRRLQGLRRRRRPTSSPRSRRSSTSTRPTSPGWGPMGEIQPRG